MSLLKNIKEHSLEKFLAVGILVASPAVLNYDLNFCASLAYAQDLSEDEKPALKVPHYLKNVDCPQDPVLKLFEKWRVYNSLSSKYPVVQRGINFLNESVFLKKEILGKEVTLTFVGYVKKGDKITMYTRDGIETLTEQEFDVVVQDQLQYIETAAKLAQEKFSMPYKKILSTVETTLRKQKRLSKEEKLEDILNKKIPEYDGLKIRDVLFVPEEMTAKDFVPTHYFFTSIPAALGVTYLGTEMVGIDPKARVLDYINGSPAILMHEMMHSNKKFEGFPLAMHFDAELWADFPMLTDIDYLDFSFHSYLKDIRKLAKILFNFDSTDAFNDVREYNLIFGTKLEDAENYKKLRTNIEITQKISKIIQETALNDFVPEFYTNPIYWITVNQFLHDDAAAFKINFYRKFEPTCLGGPEETRKFMNANKEVVREASEIVIGQIRSDKEGAKIIALNEADIRRELKTRFESLEPDARQNLCSAGEELGINIGKYPDEFIDFIVKMYQAGILDKNKIEQLERVLQK